MLNSELTKEEKNFLYKNKYNKMDLKEIEERIKMHDEECYKLLKELKKKENRKKYYTTFKK